MKTIVMDTETTGLRPGVDEVLQVAILDDTGKTLFDSYIRPEKTESWEGDSRGSFIQPHEAISVYPRISS